MKNYRHGCLLLVAVTCAACTYSQVWKQYTDSAKMFEQQKNMHAAMDMYGKAKEELKKDSMGTESYAACCSSLAVLCYYAGLLEKAEPLYLEAKQVREKVWGKAHPAYAASCNDLGVLYRYAGRYEKAEPLFLEAKQIRETVLGKQNPDYASSCNNLAVLYQNTGQYEKALPLMLEAKRIRETVLGKLDPDYARTCSNLAVLYQLMGQYEKAEPLFLEAKQVLEQVLGKQLAYASVCSHLALLYADIGQYEKAEPLLLEVKQIREAALGKQHPDYAISCSNLASVYQSTGQYEKAEPLLLEALQIEEKVFGTDHPDYAISCSNLASLYEQMEQFEKAAPFYIKAKQIAEKVLGKEHPDYITYCNNLALLYMNTRQYRKAEPLLAEAKQLAAKVLGKQHQSYGMYCGNLAGLYWLLKEPLRAEKEFEEAFAVNAYNVSSVFRFTGEKEKTAYIRNVSGENEEAYSFFMHERIPSAQPYSLALFHRNLILSSSEALKKQLLLSGDTSLVHKYEAWVSEKKHLAALYSSPVEERGEDAAAIEEKAGLQEKELTRLSAGFAKQQQRPGWKAIRSRLKEKEAAVEFASFHFSNGSRRTDTVCYAAIVLRKNMPLPVMIFLFNEPQLADLLSSAGSRSASGSIQKLYAFPGNARKGKKDRVASIYGLIWKPMERALKGINTVYFAPSGLLHRIAFAALPVNKKEVLSDRYKLVQLATTAALADQRQTYISASDRMQLYGGISYNADTAALKDVALGYHHQNVVSRSLPGDLVRGGAWNELPATKREIADIVSSSGKYQQNIISFSGLDATEESLKALDGKASPAVLHIATHGFFFPDPKEDNNLLQEEKGRVFKSSGDPLMRAGLLFAGANNAWQNKPAAGIDDGILTAYEVSNMYLPNTKLVVLSACETGLGEIRGSEGVYGLQRAFKMAGAQNLVMSLWKVSDEETAAFMAAFYKRLFEGQPVSDAFYAAQSVMKARYRLQPYRWAAWVLVR